MTEDDGYAKAVAADASLGIIIAKGASGWEVHVTDHAGDKTADVLGPFKTKRLAEVAAKELYLRRVVKAVVG